MRAGNLQKIQMSVCTIRHADGLCLPQEDDFTVDQSAFHRGLSPTRRDSAARSEMIPSTASSKFHDANPVAPIHRYQLESIRPLRPVGRSENVLGLQFFNQLAHQSALELGLGYGMPRVKVNNCIIVVGKEPPTAHHFYSVSIIHLLIPGLIGDQFRVRCLAPSKYDPGKDAPCGSASSSFSEVDLTACLHALMRLVLRFHSVFAVQS
jgi:hypothetical protein